MQRMASDFDDLSCFRSVNENIFKLVGQKKLDTLKNHFK